MSCQKDRKAVRHQMVLMTIDLSFVDGFSFANGEKFSSTKKIVKKAKGIDKEDRLVNLINKLMPENDNPIRKKLF